MLRLSVTLLCLATPALAQQLPLLDPAVQLGVCQQQKAMFLSDSEQAQTLMRQLLAENAKMKARIEELEKEKAPNQ